MEFYDKSKDVVAVPLPCPFCKCELEPRLLVSAPKRDYYIWNHRENGCFLVRHFPTADFTIDECEVVSWNTRMAAGIDISDNGQRDGETDDK